MATLPKKKTAKKVTRKTGKSRPVKKDMAEILSTSPEADWRDKWKGKLYIGTSGFSYPYWKNRFYPEGLPGSKWLQYYATQFNTLELNSSFYRFPKIAHLKKAADQTPDDFVFTVKAHKIITHTRRMKDVRQQKLQHIPHRPHQIRNCEVRRRVQN